MIWDNMLTETSVLAPTASTVVCLFFSIAKLVVYATDVNGAMLIYVSWSDIFAYDFCLSKTHIEYVFFPEDWLNTL